MKMKLNKCVKCQKYPYVEEYDEDFVKKIKIFCPHNYFDGKNREAVADNWNIHNNPVTMK